MKETEELKYAENSNESERTNHHEITYRAEYPSDVERQRTQQVDNTEETEGIVFWLVRTIESSEVFKCEEERKNVFQYCEYLLSRRREGLHAFYHDQQDARYYAPKQGDIESLSKWRVTLEDNDAQFFSKRFIVHGFLPKTSDRVHTSV